jgi:hypothetical protein
MDTSQLHTIKTYLEAERARGRVPLFVLGSGMSDGLVPSLADMGAWFRDQFESTDRLGSMTRAADLAGLLADKTRTATRREAAELFWILQKAKSPDLDDLWTKFSRRFVFGNLIVPDRPLFPGVVNVTPSRAHDALAGYLRATRAHVISLNFDGLTHKALRKDGQPAVILHDLKEVDGYFCDSTVSDQIPAVFKVRGDAFQAKCTNLQCPRAGIGYPLTQLWLRAEHADCAPASPSDTLPFESVADDKNRDVLDCQTCGSGTLRLQFSFPGDRTKEDAAYPMLWLIRRYVAQTTSAIIVVGLSGRWDEYLLNFLFDLALERDIPIIDVNQKEIDPAAARPDRVIDDFRLLHFPSAPSLVPTDSLEGRGVGLLCLAGKADDVLPMLLEPARQSRHDFPKSFPPREGRIEPKDLGRDEYFPPASGTLTLCGKAVAKPATEAYYSVPDIVEGYLKHLSQLGLKERWLGGSPDKHTRWQHSRGAHTLGHIWLRILEADKRVPRNAFPWNIDPADAWTTARVLVGHALLLHDYGHLPFSHLTEHVLRTINWVPQALPGTAPGLQGAVLRRRLDDPPEILADCFSTLDQWMPGLGARKSLEALIGGSYGVPWLQTIVNSPIDADKGDYVHSDADFFRTLHRYSGSDTSEIAGIPEWLEEFLSDQKVNHAGHLCLHGRSARAAADLWRNRMHLYNRTYISPDLRVAEAMAGEIIRSFILWAVMSEDFRTTVSVDDGAPLFGKVVGPDVGRSPSRSSSEDPVRRKFDTAVALMTVLADWGYGEDLEFKPLEIMFKSLESWPLLDAGYAKLLSKCFEHLSSLKHPPPSTLPDVVSTCLVRDPLVFHASDYAVAVETLRPIQHLHSREAIIDIIQFPRVLAPARRYRTALGRTAPQELDYGILVPEGPVATWGRSSTAGVPLTDECVTDLENPICRAIVVAPYGADRPEGGYIWDRVRRALLNANIELIRGSA